MVTIENYEEYMMLDADGELDAAGKVALQHFLAAHPELAAELAAWQSLKLQPDQTLTYPARNALLKQEPKGRIISFRPFALAAAAAVLAALVLVPALWKQDHPVIVHAFSDPQPAVPVKDYSADSLSQIGVSSGREKPQRPGKSGPSTGRNRIATHIPVNRAAVQPAYQDSMIALHGATGQLPESGIAVTLREMNEQEQMAVVVPELPPTDAKRQPFITLAPENRQAFEVLKDAFEARLAQATSAARTVKETAFEIRLGRGAINLTF